MFIAVNLDGFNLENQIPYLAVWMPNSLTDSAQ